MTKERRSVSAQAYFGVHPERYGASRAWVILTVLMSACMLMPLAHRPITLEAAPSAPPTAAGGAAHIPVIGSASPLGPDRCLAEGEPWVLHSDPEYQFSICYPSTGWRATIALENDDKPEHVIRRRTAFLGPQRSEIHIDVWAEESGLTLTEWFDTYQRPYLRDDSMVFSRGISVAGVPAILAIEPQNEVSPARVMAVLEADSTIYRLTYSASDAGLGVDTYRRMLRSFEFTGVSDTVDALPATPQDIFVGPLADSSCCGYSDSGNPYGCYSCGNCTWWASFKGSYLPDTSWGNAWQWKQAAISEGFSVGTTPQANTVVVFQPGVQGVDSTYGHVAYVESVDGSNFVVSEMWYPNGCDNVCCRVCTWRTYHSGTGVDFIYRPGTTCSAPSLNSPGDGYVHTSTDRTITFSWSPPSNCTPDGYTFRVKTVPDMDSGGTTIFDEGQGGTQVTKQFGSQWDNTDLYWSVRACKPCTPFNPGPWAPSRRFRIEPGQETHRECSNSQCVTVAGPGSDQCSSDADCGPPPGDWYVEYFPNTNLTDLCATGSHSGTFVFRDWQEDQPSGNCPPDNWSARFRRRVHFQTGSYTFALGSDDWARILVEFPPNEVVVNNWQGAGQHYESRYINEGDYWVTVEFADTLGHAKLAAWWWGPGFSMPRDSRDPNQWYAEYWGNKDLWWDSIIRVNEGSGQLSHGWNLNGPGYGLPSDRFSSSFRRSVYFDCGRYRFHVFTDDGARFWIDGQLELDKWFDGVNGYDVYADLTAGNHDLELKHYENGGAASISLEWVQESGCAVNTPSNLSATAVSQTQINLTWNDNSSDETNFHVERSADGASGWAEIGYTAEGANETTYSDTGLTCGTVYYYRVRAHRHSDWEYSDYSNVAHTTTQACPTPPDAPSNLTAAAVSQT